MLLDSVVLVALAPTSVVCVTVKRHKNGGGIKVFAVQTFLQPAGFVALFSRRLLGVRFAEPAAGQLDQPLGFAQQQRAQFVFFRLGTLGAELFQHRLQ